jgi:hypothetical protein
VTKGAFRFISGRPDAPGTTSIRTPIASIGVRGTIFDGVVGEDAARIAAGEPGVGPRVRSDPATASLIILRGPGRRTQGRVQPGVIDITSGNRTVTVDRPMRAVFVPAAGMAPIGPFTISPAGLEQVQALIFPSLAQALGLTNAPSGTGFTPPDRSLPLPPGYRGGYPGPGGYPPGPGGYPGQGGYPGEPGGPRGQGPQYPIPNLPFPTDQGGRQQPTRGTPLKTQSGGQTTPSPATVQTPAGGQVTNAGPTPNPTPTPTPTPSPTPTPKYPGKP